MEKNIAYSVTFHGDGTDERFPTIEKAMGYIEEHPKNKIKMYFFTEDENGQRNGVNSDFFERNEITEPWGKGRGCKHKTTGKMLYKKPIYHENE